MACLLIGYYRTPNLNQIRLKRKKSHPSDSQEIIEIIEIQGIREIIAKICKGATKGTTIGTIKETIKDLRKTLIAETIIVIIARISKRSLLK